MRIVTDCGNHRSVSGLADPSTTNGLTAPPQRCPASSPETLPGESSLRSGNPVRIAREVSTKARCRSSERTPRTVVAIVEPIADNDTATTASATSVSINVKPAAACECLEQVERD